MNTVSTLSETPATSGIAVCEVRRSAPGEQVGDAFAAMLRGADAPLVVIVRPGWTALFTAAVIDSLALAATACPALGGIALMPGHGEGEPALGPALDGDAVDLSVRPVALLLDSRRAAMAVGTLPVGGGDPWVEVAECLRRAGVVVERRTIRGGATVPPPEDLPDVVPAVDPSLCLAGSVARRALPDDPGHVVGREWIALWVPEPDDPAAPEVGLRRPDASWRQLAFVLAESKAGAAPVQLDDASPVLGWVMPDGLPGGIALMVFHTPDGRPVLAEADAEVPPGTPERLLGWALGAPTPAADPGAMRPLDAVEVAGAQLFRARRPGTRALFVRPQNGGLTAEPVPGQAPAGYASASPGSGLVPIIRDGTVIGHGPTRSATSGVVLIGDRPEQYVQPPVGAVGRLRRGAAAEVRRRRAQASAAVIVLPWLTTGGADIFITGLVESLRDRGLRAHVVLTYPGDQSPGDRREMIAPFATAITCAPEAMPGQPLPSVLAGIARRERAGHVIICGGWQAYAGLPGLRAALPGVRVMDILFNDFGHLASNRRMAPWIDMTVCAYDGLRDLLVSGFGEDPSRVTTTYIGIDAQRFRPAGAITRAALKRDMGFDPTRPLWGYAGRVADEKCLPDFIAAIRMVHGEVDAQFVVQGEGPAVPAVQRAIRTAGVDVVVRPFQPDQLPMLQALDAYVLPSRVEGIPLALMEAAACGAVPVATAVGGVPDLVVPGHTGFLAEAERPGSLAAALLALRDTPEWLRDEIAHRARSRVHQQMSWEGTVAAYARLLGLPG